MSRPKTLVAIIRAGSLLLALTITAALQAAEPGAHQRRQVTTVNYTDRLIIKLRAQTAEPARTGLLAAERLQALSTSTGINLQQVRPMSWGAQVVKLPGWVTLAEAEALARKLMLDPDVEYAESDRILHPLAVPNDTLFSSQWHYLPPSIEPGGVNLPPAWDSTVGQPAIIIALIDTGTLIGHADLAGRTVPGYDFISNLATANDGDGRDADATDPGDWITVAENANGPFAGCAIRNSSWHGTHTAGTIGAATNNGQGVAGINWMSKILPIRVLGKCGGFLSDVIDGERWAVGLFVPGVPPNPHPAQVLNQSLGGAGTCSRLQQAAITEIVALGKVIVVAAGNENINAANANPANCTGVITVAGTNRAGGKTSYTNFGALVDISAPGGEQNVLIANGVLSTFNTGITTPAADDYRYLAGTSFSTSHVTGIVSLMLSANPALTPAQVLAGIQTTARAFPTGTGSDCTTDLCGAGIIDAAAAVNQVRRSVTVTASDPDAAEAGLDPGSFTFTRAGDTSTALTVTYTISGNASGGIDYNTLPASVVIPANATTATLSVIPIDDSTREDTETVTLTLTPNTLYIAGTPSSATVDIADNDRAASGGGGGGGCTLGVATNVDPVLPALLIIALLYLTHHRVCKTHLRFRLSSAQN
ncbi:MAG: S8 family serine peptidase [Gammaproteobacteria bacterium]